MALPKMGGKKLRNLRKSKKKKLSCPQYFYNIFTINHTWLVIISSKKNCDKLIVAMALPKLGEKKNLWEPNCGNAIAEIGE